MTDIKVFSPIPELSNYVRYYWILKCNERFRILTFPIGCPQIIFHRKNPLYIPELNSHQSRFTISGQVNFPAHIEATDGADMVVAVFYPHTIGYFINTTPSAFYNLEISGYDIGDKVLDTLAARIMDNDSDVQCITILNNWLLSKLRQQPVVQEKRIGTAIPIILNNPQTPVYDLAEHACLSKKQFERLFREYVGMNPKEYARVVRFQKSMWLLQQGSRDFTGIACNCGYSDQSHFIREFKSMSGLTPKQLTATCQPYSDLFTHPA